MYVNMLLPWILWVWVALTCNFHRLKAKLLYFDWPSNSSSSQILTTNPPKKHVFLKQTLPKTADLTSTKKKHQFLWWFGPTKKAKAFVIEKSVHKSMGQLVASGRSPVAWIRLRKLRFEAEKNHPNGKGKSSGPNLHFWVQGVACLCLASSDEWFSWFCCLKDNPWIIYEFMERTKLFWQKV